jgi:arylsulfatase A-like enzyme
MHLYTRLEDESRYAAEKYTSEADLHGSGMLQHDHDIGVVLDFLDAQGLADDTTVWCSTDNGPEHASWPHGATTPWRGEKMTAYEGGVRVISILAGPVWCATVSSAIRPCSPASPLARESTMSPRV